MSLAVVQKRVQEANRSELARQLSVDRSHVSLVLAGKRMPSLPMAAKLARELGLSLDDLHGYLEQQTAAPVN